MSPRNAFLILTCLFLTHCRGAESSRPSAPGAAPPGAAFPGTQVHGTLQGRPLTPRSAAFVLRSYPASAMYPQGFTYLMVVIGDRDDVCQSFSAGNFGASSTTLRMEVTAFAPLTPGDVQTAYALARPRAAFSYATYNAGCRGGGARVDGSLSLLAVSDAQVSGKFSMAGLDGTFVATPCPGLDEIDNPIGPGCK